ncbi:hypothetical protein FGO68_gene14898 [Halteria grandinella]|uniref:Uncharacterized protein n=1 Tax=Halteria grandinella TaxID=5974 RepID=A0A8J8NIQ7_HALGN|nr:hypothetical protein FGO68_gene14898 [Halteria grandinella]
MIMPAFESGLDISWRNIQHFLPVVLYYLQQRRLYLCADRRFSNHDSYTAKSDWYNYRILEILGAFLSFIANVEPMVALTADFVFY